MSQASAKAREALRKTRLYRSLVSVKTWRKDSVRRAQLAKWKRGLAKRSHSDSLLPLFTGHEEPYRLVQIGDECQIEQGVQIWVSPRGNADARLVLKDRVFLGKGTYVGTHQPITIGDDSLIGAYSYIISANHSYARRDVPIREQGMTGAPIVIEDDVWLGTHVVVLPGVTIGKGAIVAAGAVVNKNIPAYEVWGGVPAKFLKERP